MNRAYKERQREYNRARNLALRDLARENPVRYAQLMEKHLGRSLDKNHQGLVLKRWQ